MRIAQVQFTPWDKVYNFDARDFNVILGDKVIVKTEMGTEMGIVVGLREIAEEELEDFLAAFDLKPADESIGEDPDDQGEKKEEESKSKDADKKETGDKKASDTEGEIDTVSESESVIEAIKPILRKATSVDIGKFPSAEDKNKAIKECKELVNKRDLPMKLVDVHYAFDGSRITFAFIADGRVDFRELVKDLTRKFNRTIRLHQIGIRDEAKIMGDYGHCGRMLCCKGYLTNLQSITSEMAELQQCAHRGSERISGICGRLMCCLAYEQNGYEDLKENMPPIGTKVNVDGKRGVIVGHHVLKQTVNVEFPPDNGDGAKGTIVEVDLNRKKK